MVRLHAQDAKQIPERTSSNDSHSTYDQNDEKMSRTFSELEDGVPRSRQTNKQNNPFANLASIVRIPDSEDFGRPAAAVRRKSTTVPMDLSGTPAAYGFPALLPFEKTKNSAAIISNVEDLERRRKFILRLAKALLRFGAPSHRIESQLMAASEILGAHAEFVHLPNIIIVTLRNSNRSPSRTYFVRATGKVALTNLHKVHDIYRDVLHDRMSAGDGTEQLRELLRAAPIYPLQVRCVLAFGSAFHLCAISFGGSYFDMAISGFCACLLQYLGLNAANKSSMYANVYEISVSILVAFVARGLSNVPENYFCYSSISSAGVVVILPGYTVLVSALELMSRNIFCGSVRMVYAIIYTLFLGFGLTIGSDFYLVVDRRARRMYYQASSLTPDPTKMTFVHGNFRLINDSMPFAPVSGVIGTVISKAEKMHVVKGCPRNSSHWWLNPVPWWFLFFLVPIYSTCSSLANLQHWKSRQLPVMVLFSCCSFAANRGAGMILPGRTDIISAAGAFVIGLLGNAYSRVVGGTAFTSMVTGVLFLVPSGIAQSGGVAQSYHSSAEQYSTGFSLALRMITVASGVTVGLFMSQVLVYLFGTRKNAGHFAF